MSMHTQFFSVAERAAHVRQANANQAIEGFHPDGEDVAIQNRYIAGIAAIDDLLAHARQFAAKALTKDFRE